jgi:23S rRNA (guanosine2251-2'-O)-methyltransferase
MNNRRVRPHRPHQRRHSSAGPKIEPQPAAAEESRSGHVRRHRIQDDRRHPGEIIFGVAPVRELVAASPGLIRMLYVKADLQDRFGPEINAVRSHEGHVTTADNVLLSRMAGSEERHQGLIAVLREYPYAPLEQVLAEKPDPLVIVDGVTDPRNLGAILRSSECAGVSAAVLAQDRTVGITATAVKSSAGAWAHLKIARCGNVAQFVEKLKAAGYWVAAMAPAGKMSLYELDTSRRLALVLGSEDRGVRELVRKTADFVVRIPMHGRVASLNVSVAAAISLFEISRRRGIRESFLPEQQSAHRR